MNGSSSSSSSAESVARAAKAAFDAAQLLADGPSERVRALKLVREALQEHKQRVLDANAQDMEVRYCGLLLLINSDAAECLWRQLADSEEERPGGIDVDIPSKATGPPVIAHKVRRHAPRRRRCCESSRPSRADHLCL